MNPQCSNAETVEALCNDRIAELNPETQVNSCNLRASTRLLNKNKIDKREDVAISQIQCTENEACKCNGSSCEVCAVTLASGASLVSKKRDFWTIQEQADFFDGLKLYGKEIHSIFLHMKSVVKRRAKVSNTITSHSSTSIATSPSAYKNKTKEQIRHFYYRKLQLCQRLLSGNISHLNELDQPRDVREVYLLLCYDALKKVFRDKLEPRLARPDFALHLGQLISNGFTVVRVGRKGRYRVKAPNCPALRSLNNLNNGEGRCSGGVEHHDCDLAGNLSSANRLQPARYSNLPASITLLMLPSDNLSWSFVQAAAHNPRLSITAPASTRLSEVRTMLIEKWCPNDNQRGAEIIFKVRKDGDTLLELAEHEMQMSLIEYLLANDNEPANSKCSDNGVFNMEYSIRTEEGGACNVDERMVLSPALKKLLYFASMRLKLFAQPNQQLANAKFQSPSSAKLPRIEEEEGMSDTTGNIDGRKIATPRRKTNQRKSVQSNLVACQPMNAIAFNMATPGCSSGTQSNTVAINFIEQLKELRGKTQRKNRQPTAAVLGGLPFNQNSDRLHSSPKQPVQQRRLVPKSVPFESQSSNQSLIGSSRGTGISSYQGNFNRIQSNSFQAYEGQISSIPVGNLVITPLNALESRNSNLAIGSAASLPNIHPSPANTYAAPPFAEASLDISLPGDSTMVELLKPSFAISNSMSETNLRLTGDRHMAGSLDMPNSDANATAGFDMSFGDPSLGGFLSSADVAVAQSLISGKTNSLNPWLIQDSSVSFFDSANGQLSNQIFDDSTFLLPNSSSTVSQNNQKN